MVGIAVPEFMDTGPEPGLWDMVMAATFLRLPLRGRSGGGPRAREEAAGSCGGGVVRREVDRDECHRKRPTTQRGPHPAPGGGFAGRGRRQKRQRDVSGGGESVKILVGGSDLIGEV